MYDVDHTNSERPQAEGRAHCVTLARYKQVVLLQLLRGSAWSCSALCVAPRSWFHAQHAIGVGSCRVADGARIHPATQSTSWKSQTSQAQSACRRNHVHAAKVPATDRGRWLSTRQRRFSAACCAVCDVRKEIASIIKHSRAES